MRHRKKNRRLGVTTPHRRSMLANLASSLIEHGGINTTDARAKELRPFVEKLVTLAKRGDLHARRVAFAALRDRRAVKRLFDEWAPRFLTLPDEREWNGGYVRILKLGRRKGDSAPISLVQFVSPDEGAAPAKASSGAPAELEPETSEQGDNPASSEADS